MPYERPSASLAVRVTAHADVRHGAIAYDGGWVGRVVKTETPAADAPRTDRDLVAAGEDYNLRPHGIAEVDNTNLAGIAKGALVYITQATNAIGNAAGAGISVVGKVTHLPGEQGTPTNRVRVDLDVKA